MTTLVIVSIAVFVLSIIGFLTFLALWTYKDAQVKSEHPPVLWVLAVLFVPNMLGILIYFLVGRTKKDVPAPGTYKKALIASLVTFVIGIILFVIAVVMAATGDMNFGNNATWNSGVWSVRTTNYRNNQWTETVRSGRGNSRRTHTLDAQQMSAFHVESVNESGNLYLLLEQGNNSSRIDISGDFYSGINLHDHGFTPGRIRMTLQYERVYRSHTVIRWRV